MFPNVSTRHLVLFVVETIHHLPIPSGNEMPVGVDRQLDRVVPELFLHVSETLALLNQERRERVAEIVYPAGAKPRATTDSLHDLPDPHLVEWVPFAVGEEPEFGHDAGGDAGRQTSLLRSRSRACLRTKLRAARPISSSRRFASRMRLRTPTLAERVAASIRFIPRVSTRALSTSKLESVG
jgi:hypothetical protein